MSKSENSDLSSSESLSEVTISNAINSQDAFFNEGHTLSYSFRLKSLIALQKNIRIYEPQIIDAIHQDLRKHPTEVYASEIGFIYSELRHAIKNLRKWMKPQKVKTPTSLLPGSSSLLKHPFGRVLIISPWNYPFLLAISPLVGAIAAGNVVILKPSELSPHTSKVLEQLINATFMPSICKMFLGDQNVAKQLLKFRWNHIFFTGSTNVGRIVAKAAAEHLTPCVLELGGKTPAIITENASLKLAARRILFGKMFNSGQTCVAPDYVLAVDTIHDQLLESLKKEIILRFGEQPINNLQLPKIINVKHFRRLEGFLIKDKIFYGGQLDDSKLLIAPTLMCNIEADDPIMQEEIFGPILPIVRVSSLEDAIAFVKAREKPLALYAFTESKSEYNQILTHLNFGGSCLNDTVMQAANLNLPFGGVGNSGMGANHGQYTFNCFSHTKSVFKAKTFIDIPIRYHPWKKWKDRIFRLLIR